MENLTKVFKEQWCSVSQIINDLCAADKDHLTFFSSDKLLNSAKTIDDVSSYVKYHCKYCDLGIIKPFIDASKCIKAMKLMKIYFKEIEDTIILDSDLGKLEYGEQRTEEQNMTQLILVCEANHELLVKEYNSIIGVLSGCFKLPKASILLRHVVEGYFICKIPLKVQEYLMGLKIIACELKPLSTLLKIKSLIIDEMELQLPLDCDTEVNTIVGMELQIPYTVYVVCLAVILI